MGLIVNTIVLLCFAVSVMRSKKKSRFPIMLFLGLWTLILTMYNLQILDLMRINDYAWMVLFVGICMFSIGYNIGETFIINRDVRERDNKDMYNEKIILIILISAIVLYILFFATNISMVLHRVRTLNENKMSFVTGETEGNRLYQYYVRPVSFMMTYLVTYGVFYRKGHYKIIAILFTVLKIIEFLVTGSKMNVFNIILCLFILIIHNRSRYDYIFKRIIRKIRTIIVIMVIGLIIYMSTYQNALNGVILYLVGCVPMLGSMISYSGTIFPNYANGFVTLHGIFRVFSRVAGLLGFHLWEEMLDYSQSIIARAEFTHQIGGGITYNGFVTAFSNFYNDLGIIGVIIFSFLFGFLAAKIYRKYIDNPMDLFWTSVYMFVITSIFWSFLHSQLSSVVSVLSVVYSYLFFADKKVHIGFNMNTRGR